MAGEPEKDVLADTYDVDDYESDERGEDPCGPLVENQVAATQFIAGLARQRGFPYAVMGGFAMVLRGSKRRTRDVDIIIQAPGPQIRDMIKAQRRLKIPSKRFHGGVIRTFVKTGPGHDNCKDTYEVEVDIVVADKGYSGPKGSPVNIENGRDILRFSEPASGELIAFEVLDLRWMMKTKMFACSQRLAHRDYTDLEYLVATYTDEVRSFLHELDHEQVDHWLDGLAPIIQKDMRAKLGM